MGALATGCWWLFDWDGVVCNCMLVVVVHVVVMAGVDDLQDKLSVPMCWVIGRHRRVVRPSFVRAGVGVLTCDVGRVTCVCAGWWVSSTSVVGYIAAGSW